ncbi:MAG TPA: hypothetical protein VJU16_05075 [Planctomycetota bacterium]|nr:hypothetical protein [Planctomycetota bacterium]
MQFAIGWLPALTSALLLILAAASFLPHQCLWIDETTQMKGLTLGAGEQVRWLAGEDPGRFGVPGDRMPPLSYAVGGAWSGVFGLTERAMRWLGICLVAIAAMVVARTAGSFSGIGGAFIAGTVFTLSPNVITYAVEIRAYPLFLLTSACSFLAFTKIVLRPADYPARWAVALAAALVASMYTHFYGLFLASGLGGVSLLVVWKHRGPLRPLLLALGVSAALAFGLLPFLTASVSASSGVPSSGAGIREFVRLPYRLMSHPAISISFVAAGLAVLGMAGLLLLAVLSRSPQSRTVRFWALAPAIGLAATVSGGLFVRGFNALSPSYSIWVVPGMAVLASMAWLSRDRIFRALALGAVSLVIAAQGYGALQLVTRGDLFAHGPHRQLEGLVRRHGAAGLAVLHDTPEYGVAYFPLHYEFGRDLKQYVIVSENPVRVAAILPAGFGLPTELGGLEASRVIVVRTAWLGAGDLRLETQGRRAPLPPGPIASALTGSAAWRLQEASQVAATAGAAIHVFER